MTTYGGYIQNSLVFLDKSPVGGKQRGRVLCWNGDYLFWQELELSEDEVEHLPNDLLNEADDFALDQFAMLEYNRQMALVMAGSPTSMGGDPWAKGTRVKIVHPPTKGRSRCPAGSTGTINWHSDDGHAVGIDLDSETEVYAGKVKPRRVFVQKYRSDEVTARVEPLAGITDMPDFLTIRNLTAVANQGLEEGALARKWGNHIAPDDNDLVPSL